MTAAVKMASRFLDVLDFHLEGPTSRRVVLDAPLRFRHCTASYSHGSHVYMVRTGFRNDLASVPLLLRSLAPPWQQSARAGVLHDMLYRFGGYQLAGGVVIVSMPRKRADSIFRDALRSEGVGRIRSWAMYRAVRLFAGGVWRRYRSGELETR